MLKVLPCLESFTNAFFQQRPSTPMNTPAMTALPTCPAEKGYRHRRINHTAKVYVVGDIHTNTIEGFWSLVKRGIGGVYHSVSQKYLQSYLNEYSFRYNHRLVSRPMFVALLDQVSVKAE